MPPHRNMDPAREYASALNFMERYGLEFLRRRSDRAEPQIHPWTDADRAKIRRLERHALLLAGLSGAGSGAIIAALELGLRAWLVNDAEAAPWNALVPYWAAYLGLAGLVTAVEVFALYWLVLRAVARVGALAGLRFSGESIEQAIAAGLSRAALDMPNPYTQFYGIDPYARVPRWQLVLYTIVYRAKVGATSVVLRLLLRRILVRAALRFLIPFITIPVFAAWNALIVSWIMREARARAAGPFIIAQLSERVRAVREHLGADERRLLIAMVAETMMAARDAHPNFLLLLTRLKRDLELDPGPVDIEWDAARHLRGLDPVVQEIALLTVTVAAVLGGAPGRRRKRLVEEAWRAAGHRFSARDLSAVHHAFIDGHGIADELDRAVARLHPAARRASEARRPGGSGATGSAG